MPPKRNFKIKCNTEEQTKSHKHLLNTLPSILTQKEDFSNFFKKSEETEEEVITPDDILPYYNFDIPDALYWDVDEVRDWLVDIVKLPQYQNTFHVNQITGKNLLHLIPDRMPLLGIQDFDHIKHLNKCIKELYDIECEGFDNGDISLPALKFVRYQYLVMKSRTGYKYEHLTPKDFMVSIAMDVPEQEEVKCTWENIEPGIRKLIPLKAARTGSKRLPGEPRDLSKSVSFRDLNKKELFLNEEYPFDLKIKVNDRS